MGQAENDQECSPGSHPPETSPNRQGLRSAEQTLLSAPRFNRSWGDRSFASSAHHLWNSLPENIRTNTSLDSFKRLIKTHLMTSFISTL